jgi:hypothetical protein
VTVGWYLLYWRRELRASLADSENDYDYGYDQDPSVDDNPAAETAVVADTATAPTADSAAAQREIGESTL